jgi:hypothetical protein
MPLTNHVEHVLDGIQKMLMQHALRNIARGAGPERFDGNFLATLARHQNYRNVRMLLGNLGDEVQPRHARHYQVSDDQAGRVLPDASQRLLATGRNFHLQIPPLGQEARRQLAVHGRVIDHQHGWHGKLSLSSGGY